MWRDASPDPVRAASVTSRRCSRRDICLSPQRPRQPSARDTRLHSACLRSRPENVTTQTVCGGRKSLVGESSIAAINGSSADESAPSAQQQISYDERFSIVVGVTGALPFNPVRDERIPEQIPTSEQLHRHALEANRRAPKGAVAGRSISDLADSLELSAREHEVLTHIRLGLTNREIAERLFVSTNTVNKHVHQVLRKLNVRNRVQAAIRTPVAMN